MGLQTSSSPDRGVGRRRGRRGLRTAVALLALLALTVALSACGGGTTGPPVAAAPQTQATTPGADPAVTQTQPTSTSPPAKSPSATTPQAPARRPARRHRSAGTRTQTQPAPQTEPAPTPRKAAPAPEPAGVPLDEFADLRLTDKPSPTHYFQAGTVTGTFDGTMQLEARVVPKGVAVQFTATVAGGTITGKGLAIPVIGDSPMADLNGTAEITGGTGRFASIQGRGLTVTGKAKLDGSHARVRLTGTVTF